MKYRAMQLICRKLGSISLKWSLKTFANKNAAIPACPGFLYKPFQCVLLLPKFPVIHAGLYLWSLQRHGRLKTAQPFQFGQNKVFPQYKEDKFDLAHKFLMVTYLLNPTYFLCLIFGWEICEITKEQSLKTDMVRSLRFRSKVLSVWFDSKKINHLYTNLPEICWKYIWYVEFLCILGSSFEIIVPTSPTLLCKIFILCEPFLSLSCHNHNF